MSDETDKPTQPVRQKKKRTRVPFPNLSEILPPLEGAAPQEETPSGQDPKLQRLYLMVDGNKPVFPGLMFPLPLSTGIQAETFRKANSETHEMGFVLTVEQTDSKKSGKKYSENSPATTDGQDSAEDISGQIADAKTVDEAAELLDKAVRKICVQKHLASVGCSARIMRFEELPDGNAHGLFQGLRRFRLEKAQEENGCLVGYVEYLKDIPASPEEAPALTLALTTTMRKLHQLNPPFADELQNMIERATPNELGKLCDFTVVLLSAPATDIQKALAELDVAKRARLVLLYLKRELATNKIKETISREVERRLSKQQREYVLREQIRVIREELGYAHNEKSDEELYQARLEEIKPHVPEEVARKFKEEISKLNLQNQQSPDYTVSKNYLDCMAALPWIETTIDDLDVARARKILNRDHYGLEDVKKRILEFIGVAKMRNEISGTILCLVGPPGVGKTSLGRSIAEALNRKFFRFSLGGMRDEAEIKGHRRTYIGALPGKIIEALKICQSRNPVIMLDEIDKLGQSYQGDPASALLEVLDPEQNMSFRDHYLDVPFDLSQVLFIATANSLDTIPPPLLDRMELITLSGYITDEKLEIAKRHLIPKQLPRQGLTDKQLSITTPALRDVINGYAREAGVRALEKSLKAIMRKVATDMAEDVIPKTVKVTVSPKELEKYLGKPRFEDDEMMTAMIPGVAMGLAWTAIGGATLSIEAVAVEGKEDLRLTGQLGDVMKESIRIACTMLEANRTSFGISEAFFKKHAIHLHVPAGATPKDGPSAGITMATAVLSLARQQALPEHWAMTGELTLTGRVLPVGGIKEKVIAAKRAGAVDIIMPKSNEKDFSEIPENVRKGLTVHYVQEYRQVFELLFK